MWVWTLESEGGNFSLVLRRQSMAPLLAPFFFIHEGFADGLPFLQSCVGAGCYGKPLDGILVGIMLVSTLVTLIGTTFSLNVMSISPYTYVMEISVERLGKRQLI